MLKDLQPELVGKRNRHVFISYSRKDGSDTASRLEQYLEAVGCEVWIDRDRLLGGSSWTREIEKALRDCDVLIAVLTEGSYVSEVCRAEQMWAIEEGKRVIPVMATPGAPRPLYLSTLTYRTFPDQGQELLLDINTGSTQMHPGLAPSRYDTIPPLPVNFVSRSEGIVRLRELVFAEGYGTSIAVTAVAGMGGVGKTVLVSALCRDKAVQRAFPDGIAWITIGRGWDGDFVPRMREVAKVLGDDLSNYDNPLACQHRYRNTLREKAALVVADDVWDIEHLTPLIVDAPRSRFLFTTRNGGIARAITNRNFATDLLQGDEARDLLASSARIKRSELPPEAEGILRACGGLAGAIAQIGASLFDLSISEWRDTLQALEDADISAIENQLPSGQTSFFKSLAVSISAIPDVKLRDRYYKLAVLLEDSPAPLAVLRTLWAITEREARQTARYFVDRSLATWESTVDPSRGIRLHDLQIDYLRALYRDRKGLELIQSALRLSSHVLETEPDQFASQVTGRLLVHKHVSGIGPFLDQMATGAARPWVRPLQPALHPAGTRLLRTLEGHRFQINGVAISTDGTRVVSSGADHQLRVWDLSSGRTLRILEGHSSFVTAVAISKDGTRAVSASYDKTLKVWNLAGGQLLRTLDSHLSHVNAVALTPDGRWAVSGSSDQTLKLWHLDTGRPVRTFAGHAQAVNAVAFLPGARCVVSASSDETLKVWDLVTGTVLRTLQAHSFVVTGVAVTPDGRFAISSSLDRTINVWDLQTGQLLRTLEGHSGAVRAVDVTPNGQLALSASSDHTLKVWDLEMGRALQTLEGHSGVVTSVMISADGTRAVSGSEDSTLKVWDLTSLASSRIQENQPNLVNHLDIVASLATTPDGGLVLSASFDGTVKVWDTNTGRPLRSLARRSLEGRSGEEGHAGSVLGVAALPDGHRGISASEDGTLKVWDLTTGIALRTFRGHFRPVEAVTVTPDGRWAVSASSDRTVKVWQLADLLDLRSDLAFSTLEGHKEAVLAVAVTADGKQAISSSRDTTLRVWDLATSRCLRTLEGHSDKVLAVAVMAGDIAISASRDETLKVWNTANGRVLRSMQSSSGSLLGISAVPSRRRVVSAHEDHTIRVWDVDRGTIVAAFHCDAPATCCACIDGERIVAGDHSGRVYFLRLEE